LWIQNGNNIYNSNAGRVGIGLTAPNGKVTIQGDTSNVLFEVRDKNGIPVFVVYQDSVHVYVSNTSAKTNKGTFAVNGKTQSKAGAHTIFRVVPDSIVEIKDANGLPIFKAFQDSVQVFVDNSGAKTNKGTFAVNGKTQSKAGERNYLRISPDSSRVYTEDPTAGFGVRDLSSGTATSYMQLTPENYFIGHDAGKNNQTGLYNIYLGYESGKNSLLSSYCTFLGYNTGVKNESSDNTFIGFTAGQNHTIGGGNVFLGSKAGQNDSLGVQNVFIGEYAGFNNLNGHNNVYMGYSCGKKNTVGSWNVFLGNEAGRENLDGNRNIAIGCNAFMNNLSGENNIALGYYAMSNNINGFNNIALGNGSLSNNINGNSNIGLGASSLLKMKNGTNNICIGFAALMTDTSGNYNTCIGDNVMIYSFGNGNVAVGNVALNKNIGNHNTAVGNAAFNNPNAPTNFENSTAIGFESYITASNQVRIGNAFVTSIGGFQNWTNISDKRFKQEINENVPGLAFIMKLKPVTYKLNYREIANYLNKKNYADLNSTNLQTGFIAQDVEKAANELGFEFSGIDKPKNEKDYYGLRYAEFTVPLVKAVQEQQLQIEQLKNENKALKEEINKIKKSLNK